MPLVNVPPIHPACEIGAFSSFLQAFLVFCSWNVMFLHFSVDMANSLFSIMLVVKWLKINIIIVHGDFCNKENMGKVKTMMTEKSLKASQLHQ